MNPKVVLALLAVAWAADATIYLKEEFADGGMSYLDGAAQTSGLDFMVPARSWVCFKLYIVCLLLYI